VKEAVVSREVNRCCLLILLLRCSQMIIGSMKYRRKSPESFLRLGILSVGGPADQFPRSVVVPFDYSPGPASPSTPGQQRSQEGTMRDAIVAYQEFYRTFRYLEAHLSQRQSPGLTFALPDPHPSRPWIPVRAETFGTVS
jgi:hypothetical protein